MLYAPETSQDHPRPITVLPASLDHLPGRWLLGTSSKPSLYRPSGWCQSLKKTKTNWKVVGKGLVSKQHLEKLSQKTPPRFLFHTFSTSSRRFTVFYLSDAFRSKRSPATETKVWRSLCCPEKRLGSGCHTDGSRKYDVCILIIASTTKRMVFG